MMPISYESISDMRERVKNAFSTAPSIRRTIEEGKSPKEVIKDNSKIINNPGESLIISDSRVTKGKIVEALNKKDDQSLKSLIDADQKGKTTTVTTRDFLTENANLPPKIEA